MRCILCFTTSSELIEIFGARGMNLDIKTIISKHFWLEPNQKDPATCHICSSCWETVESFHKFYKGVEAAHCSLGDVKTVFGKSFEESADAANLPNSNDIKIENYNDEFKNEALEPEEEEVLCSDKELDTSKKSGSESEVPLSLLVKPPRLHNSVRQKKKKNTDAKRKKRKLKEEPFHIVAGKWLATSFNEETSRRKVSHEELDKFIKENIDLSCGICLKAMTNFKVLEEHFKTAHASEKPYVECCAKKLWNRALLVDHELLHKLPEYFTCVICSKVFCSRTTLKGHIKWHDRKRIYSCDKCDLTFYNEMILLRHLDTHLERTFKCNDCEKLFTTNTFLAEHVKRVHQGQYNKVCDKCGKIYQNTEMFLRHQMEHANIPKPTYECDVCGQKIATKKGLQAHKRNQHPNDDREHVCNVCGKVTKSLIALKSHTAYVHKYEHKHKCTICDKAYKRGSRLKLNEEEHNDSIICCTCWNIVNTFHIFHEEVSRAHYMYIKFKPNDKEDKDNLDESFTSSNLNSVSDLVDGGIKVELNDEAKSELQELEEVQLAEYLLDVDVKSDNTTDHDPDVSMKSDSESEIPLSVLCSLLRDVPKPPLKKKSDDPKPLAKKMRSRELKRRERYEGISHIKEGKWLASCFNEETIKKSVPTEELDKYIEKNIENMACGICLEKSSNFATLRGHFERAHTGRKPFVVCCGKMFHTRALLVDHNLLHSLPYYFTCVICSKVLKCRLTLKSHIKWHNRKRDFQCEKCSKTFYDIKHLQRHMTTHMERTFKCDECDKFFTTDYTRKLHVNQVHRGCYDKVCEQCGKIFRDMEMFSLHQMDHANQPKPTYECDKCGVKLSTTKGLRKHFKEQHSEDVKEHTCDICGKITKSLIALRGHIAYVHKYERRHKCTLCDKAYKKARRLKLVITPFPKADLVIKSDFETGVSLPYRIV